MKRRTLALFAGFLSAIIILSAVGCSEKKPSDTSDTTTTAATTAAGISVKEFVDESEDKVAERTVTFGEGETVIKYVKTEVFDDLNQKFDVYSNGEDEYRYIFNTDTLNQITIAKFSTAQTAGEAQSVARDFIRNGVKYSVKYQADVTENDNYFKVVFTISSDESLAIVKDPAFKEITAFIPKVTTLATFAFEEN
ncbi:MAG: hypothetical protein IJR55_03250 [Clostridia bacterium]|nr:hypothetical protein [Clostridia bacterium]